MDLPESNSKLCIECTAIFAGELSGPYRSDPNSERREENRQRSKHGLDRLKSINIVDILQDSATQNDCAICKILSKHFSDSQNRPPWPWQGLEFKLSNNVTADADPSPGWNLNISYMVTRGQTRRKRIALLPAQGEEIEQHYTLTKKQLITIWMNECVTHHEKCGRRTSSTSWLPTRLLEIQCEGLCRLIETTERQSIDRYLTLSHRWGNSQMKKLTTETLGEMKKAFPTQSLPKTFQDSISIAMHLGIHYIWIDSLCIIQDSKEDWEREAELMCNVYSNAFCNLAATGALDSSGGLFLDNTPAPEPIHVSIPLGSTSPSTWRVIDPTLWLNHVGDAPLNTRGWVLQERFLARRTIHFGESQAFWECQEKEACEEYPHGLDRAIFDFDLYYQEEMIGSKSIGRKLPLRDVEGNTNFDFKWNVILNRYSALKLTEVKDREAALIGIAKSLACEQSSTWIAGMWEHNMPFELLWRGYGCSVPTYRAPSWSWLSKEGQFMSYTRIGNVEWRNCLVKVEELKISRSGTQRLSPIQSGHITLKGRLTPAKCREHIIRISDSWRIVLGDNGWNNQHCRCYFDELGKEFSFRGSGGYCLPIELALLDNMKICTRGLLLQECGSSGKYKRVGVFQGFGHDFVKQLLPSLPNSSDSLVAEAKLRLFETVVLDGQVIVIE